MADDQKGAEAEYYQEYDADFNFIGDYLRRKKMLVKSKNGGRVPEFGEHGETLKPKKGSPKKL